MKKISILVDEQNDNSKYIVVTKDNGGYDVITRGLITTPEQLHHLQLHYGVADVQIDCTWMDTRLQRSACNFGWKLIKFKPNEFPFIEAMVQLL